MSSMFKQRLISIIFLLCSLSLVYGFFNYLNLSIIFFKILFVIVALVSLFELSPLCTLFASLRSLPAILSYVSLILYCVYAEPFGFSRVLFGILSLVALFLGRLPLTSSLISGSVLGVVTLTLIALKHLWILLESHSYQYVISLQVIASLSDTFAYCAGVALKAAPLKLAVSPKKSLLGFVAALFCAPLVYFNLSQSFFLYPFSFNLALKAVAISILGDLVYSLPKRLLNIKDYGTLLPGHGGVLDRLDSVFSLLAFTLVAL